MNHEPLTDEDLNHVEHAHTRLTRCPLRIDGADIESVDDPNAPRGFRDCSTLAACLSGGVAEDVHLMIGATPALVAEVRSLRSKVAELEGERDEAREIAKEATAQGPLMAKLEDASLVEQRDRAIRERDEARAERDAYVETHTHEKDQLLATRNERDAAIKAISAERERRMKQVDYSVALQRMIEALARGERPEERPEESDVAPHMSTLAQQAATLLVQSRDTVEHLQREINRLRTEARTASPVLTGWERTCLAWAKGYIGQRINEPATTLAGGACDIIRRLLASAPSTPSHDSGVRAEPRGCPTPGACSCSGVASPEPTGLGDGPTREKIEDERDAEWQRRLMPFHEGFDGDGCDSGDPIDWTVAALGMKQNALANVVFDNADDISLAVRMLDGIREGRCNVDRAHAAIAKLVLALDPEYPLKDLDIPTGARPGKAP